MARSARRKEAVVAVLIGAATFVSNLATAQSYPSRPVRIVVPGTGGGGDFAARLIGQGLAPVLGQPFVVENRPVGTIPGEIVSRAAPDGHTLLLSASTLWLAPLLQPNVPYDPQRDFVPVSMVTRYDFAVAVGPAVPVRELSHLLAWLRANPEKANFGVPATGSLPHFFALMIGDAAAIKAQRGKGWEGMPDRQSIREMIAQPV